MSAHLDRAQILLEQSRFELAEKELRLELAEDPDHPLAHALLALCLARAKNFKSALSEAKLAIHLGPDLAFSHYVLASVLDDQERYAEAETAVQEALRLDPEDPDYFAMLSQIKLNQRQWPEALEAAERGLQLDSEHVSCTNLRAIALVKLNRKEEAGATIATALRRDPENAISHANQGWTLLQRHEPEKAMEHFREALRLDPELDWAREGIVEALKARHFIYRIMLGYFFWMSRLSSRAQWGVVIGGYLGYRVLLSFAENNPAAAPFIWPVLILYIIFAVLTWIARPLFNLLLRLHRFGRLALSREQIVASNWVGGCLGFALFNLAVWLLTNHPTALIAGITGGAMVIPIAGSFYASGKRRRTLMIYTLVLAGLAIALLTLDLFDIALASSLFWIFLLGIFAFQWVANALLMR